ncbi:unnamed protein product [Rotaria sp. Silwood2]|nr:unnamed protein product [Rotaria sp. Silwood2]
MITRAYGGIRLKDIIRQIYIESGDGIRGFYKGYLITLSMSLPFNSIVWTLYWKIQSQFERIISRNYDYIVSPSSATLAALLASYITQPIDVLKTRLQVALKKESILKTFIILIRQRGFKGLFAGSIPRASIIVPNTVIMMSLYEIIKRASAKSKT